ncbi:MAG: DHA2 family efflux MFS transporter permease subunit [Acidimicrobiia bacterium]
MAGEPPFEPVAGPELRIVEGPATGQTVALGERVVIGRDRACDVLVADDEVSRRHVRITPVNGHAQVEDLGSLNGTFVNNERILEPRTIELGDRIELGGTVLELAAAGSAPIVRPEPAQASGVGQVLAQPSRFLASGSSSRKWWTLVVVCTANFMLLLDTTIVSVALPAISNSLKTTFTELQWVVDAYSLILAVVLLTAGTVSDIIGRRVVFLVGVIIFTAASAVCGLAGSPTVLDVTRGVQGLGGGLMLAPSLALLAQEFPPRERANAFAIWGAVTAGAIAAGPLVGGVLTDAFGWQAIFFVNVPIGIAAIVVTLTKLVNLPGPPSSIDWFGLVTFSTAIFMLVFALIRGNDEGWGSTLIVALLVGGVVELVVFVLGSKRVASPMLDLSLFAKPTCSGAAIAAFAVSASVLALIIYLTLWLESIRDYSPFQTGLRLLPLTMLGLFLKPVASRLSDRVAPSVFLGGGLALAAVGLLQMSSVGTNSHWTLVLPGLVLCGVGLGLIGPTLAQVSVGIVPPQQSGMASGVNTTFRQLGLVTGIAALGAVFQHQVRVHVSAALAGTQAAYLGPSFANSVSSGGTVAFVKRTATKFHATLDHAAQVSFSAGFSEILLFGSVIAFVGAVGALLLVRRRDLVSFGGPPPGAGPPTGGRPIAPVAAGAVAPGAGTGN